MASKSVKIFAKTIHVLKLGDANFHQTVHYNRLCAKNPPLQVASCFQAERLSWYQTEGHIHIDE
jgi:hypothetical protein